MRKILYFLGAMLALVSCADNFQVKGLSSVHYLEGKTLYLKAFVGDKLEEMDSCKVVHGKFSFSGNVDSVVMATLYVGDECVMPLVLETGKLTVDIGEAEQNVTGSELNDSLFCFIKKKTVIDKQMNELYRKESRMIMDGIDHETIVTQLNEEARVLMEETDALVTKFITSNYDNVLGPGVFMIVTSDMQYPVLTPQIEQIMLNATTRFKSHPYVEEYISVAEENMEKLNAVEE